MGLVLALVLMGVGASGAQAAPKGVIATFGSAGTGPGQFSNAADGLRAVAVDQASGHVYVVDGGNHRVQRFTATGQFLSQLGSGSAGTTGGLFNSPFGVAVDADDSAVYVSDGANLRVQKFSDTGAFIRAFGWDTILADGMPPNSNGTAFEVCDTTTLIPNQASHCKNGVGGTGDGQFGSAHGFSGAPAVDPNTGAVYVADPGAPGATGRRVQRFNGATGAFEGRWGGQGTGLGQFGTGLAGGASPHRLAVDSTGAVYVVDVGRAQGSGRVQKCEPSGVPPAVTATCSLFAAYPNGQPPVAVAVNPTDDHVFVAHRRNGNDSEIVIDEFASSGGPPLETHGVGVGIGHGVPTTPAFNLLPGLAVHGATGRVYLTIPTTNPRVWVFDDVPPPSVSVGQPTDVTSTSATLHATITPAATGPTGVPTLYRFEYSLNDGIDWIPATESFVNVGNGSGTGDPSSCPTDNPPTCEVSLNLTGIDPGEVYRVRVVARTEFGGAEVIEEGPGFSTPSAPPLATTGPAMWSSPADTEPTLLLTGQVNPRGAPATYRFEYVPEQQFADSGFAGASTIPVTPADAGAGRRAVVVRRSVSGLDATKGYRYRLTAANGAGSASGDTRAVEPPEPGGRFYELVSVGDSWSQGVAVSGIDAISDDGERASFDAMAFEHPDSVPGVSNLYIAERGASGWEVHAPFPPGELAYGDFGLFRHPLVAADLRSVIAPESDRPQRQRAEVRWMRTALDGSRTPASDLIDPVSFDGEPNIQAAYVWSGGASDLSTFTFRFGTGAGATVHLLPDEQPLDDSPGQANLYAIYGATGPSPALGLVNRLSDPAPGVPGAPIGGVCGAGLGGTLRNTPDLPRSYRAVSADGSVIYFSAALDAPSTGDCTDAVQERVFKRVNGTTTVAVSESQCARVSPPCAGSGNDEYQSASTDGEVVFFTSARQLTDSDLDVGGGFGGGCGGFLGTGCDLYVYDADPPAGQPELVQASAGEVTAGHPIVGSGASVLDFLDSSSDGSRVYFTASGALTGANRRGVAPVAGERNAYVFQRDDDHPSGRLEFVAPSRPGEATDFVSLLDGVVVFATAAPVLPAEDGDSVRDIYRYDDATGAVECVSCAGDAPLDASMTGNLRIDQVNRPNHAQSTRAATPDGSAVVFATAESLLAADANATHDVYLWRRAEGLSLVSGGTGSFGVLPRPRPAGISPDGRSAFFVTEAPLVASDGNGRADVYAARVGGGFPAAATPPEPCDPTVDECQGGGAAGLSGSVSTSAPQPQDNVRPTGRMRLALRGLSPSARRRAARTGRLTLGVRTTATGRVSVRAVARLGKRRVTVARATVRLARPGRATVRLRLSNRALRALRGGRSLRLHLVARQAGARPQSTVIVLRRGRR